MTDNNEMSYDDAVKILNIFKESNDKLHPEILFDAIDMAISALEFKKIKTEGFEGFIKRTRKKRNEIWIFNLETGEWVTDTFTCYEEAEEFVCGEIDYDKYVILEVLSFRNRKIEMKLEDLSSCAMRLSCSDQARLISELSKNLWIRESMNECRRYLSEKNENEKE